MCNCLICCRCCRLPEEGGGGWGGVVVLAIPQTKAQSLFVRSRCLAGAANTCVIQHSALSAAHKKWGIQFHGILHDLLY